MFPAHTVIIGDLVISLASVVLGSYLGYKYGSRAAAEVKAVEAKVAPVVAKVETAAAKVETVVK